MDIIRRPNVRRRLRRLAMLFLAALLAIFLIEGNAEASAPVTSFTQNPDGVTFTLQTGVMQLNVYTNIVRVRYSTAPSLPSKSSLIINKAWPASTSFTVANNAGTVVITTSALTVTVNKSTAAITYQDLQGRTLLAEDPTTNCKTMSPTTVHGTSTNTLQTLFSSPSNEAFYGLGNHQDSIMNYKGHNEVLDQQNVGGTGAQIGLPFVLSTQGYGLLWDTYAKSTFFGGNGSDTPTTQFRFQAEAGDMIDYWFVYGPTFDQIISNYRAMTGQAPMFPKWAYGLFQSYEHYNSQAEVESVASSYRSGGIPLDAVVQDWRYWDPAPWGSHVMDPARYPNPAQMMTDLHNENVHGMISVWGYFALGDNNYNALLNAGALYNGQGNYYDAYNANGRSLFWSQLRDELFNNYGWDAWWLDSSEWDGGYPTCCFDRHDVTTALGPGSIYYNAYPLMHSTSVYTGQRATTSSKRVFILTRSAYPGQQRLGSAIWSGDISSDWASFARQIPAGLNFSMSGIPYWNTDIGGFQGADWTTAANNELFTRWLQFGAFCPIFRIHGEGHREIYGSQWTSTTQANLIKTDNLRYRLLPYIYSLANMVTTQSYTMMRPLVMDYPTDPNAIGNTSQFMFGPAFLVNPVTTAGATTRSVYLPVGTWYDFWTGSTASGGSTVNASAPLDHMPLYIKAGSIVPMGPNIQYAGQSVDPIEVRVYRGANGSFTLYEDEGDNYNYESGTSATIPFTYNDSTGTLTIGARSGSFPGMLSTRTFNVVFVQSGFGTGVNVTSGAQSVTYNGSAVQVTAGSGPTEAPYLGTPWAIPGTVQAENYDTGGEGLAYHDSDTVNSGGAYRTDGVDVEACTDTGGGFNVGWTNSGEWMKYTINVATAGTYTLGARVASGGAGGTFHIENSSGANLSGTITCPATGGWQTFTTVNVNVTLPAGQQILKLVIDNSAGTVNINYLTFTLNGGGEGPYLGTPWAIPGTIQSENYDTGGEGVAYHDAEAANQGGQYRTADGVDVEASTDTGGGYDVGWNFGGEWQKYTVNVSAAGTYAVSFRVANGNGGNGAFHLQNAAGTNLSGTVTVTPTGGWQTWTTVTANVSLPAGQQILTVWDDTGSYNLNYMTFAAQGGGTAPSTPTLSASAGNSQVTLTWSTSTGSPTPTYNVLRGTTSGGETTIATNVASGYVSSGLTNGTQYFFKVQAVNSVGTATSNEVGATPAGSAAPPAPTNLGATSPSANHINLAWIASSGATSYQVFRGTSAGGEGATAIGTPSTNSYADSGLTDGSKYYYTVKAVNANGTSGISNEANAISGAIVSGIDLIITSISWIPTTLSSGAHVIFSCVVKNQGQTATPAGTIVGCQFAIDGATSPITWSDTDTTSLGPGQSVTLTANNGTNSVNYWSAVSGSHTVQAWVDDVNRIAESNESNNKTTASISVP